MTVENRISSIEQVNFLPGFKSILRGGVLFYYPEEGEMLALDEEGVRATPLGKKHLSPKKPLFGKVRGWTIRIEKLNEEQERAISASWEKGRDPSYLFKNIFIIDDKLGRVRSLNLSEAGSSLQPLEKDNQDDQLVLISVVPSKTDKERGGVLVTSTKELRKLQNQKRIEGFLTA